MQRPLLYKVAVCLPMDSGRVKEALQVWKAANSMKQGLTDGAKVPKLSDMVWVMDISDDALPDTSEVDQTKHAPHTYSQLGVDAAAKAIGMFMEGMHEIMDASNAVIIVDLHPLSLDFARAVLTTCVNQNVVYVGFSEDEEHCAWAKWFIEKEATCMLKDNSLKLQGFELPPEELPVSMAKGDPPKPDMNFLTWTGTKHQIGPIAVEVLGLPEKFLKLYHDHLSFGPEFREWHKKATQLQYLDYKPTLGIASDQPMPTYHGSSRSGSEPPVKKLKVVDAIPAADVPSPLVHDIPLPKSKVRLSVATGYSKYLVNPTSEPITLSPGTSIAEFFKGKWAQTEAAESKSAAVVPFMLHSSEDYVKCGGVYSKIGDLLEAKIKNNPEQAAVRYHSKADAPVPGWWRDSCQLGKKG